LALPAGILLESFYYIFFSLKLEVMPGTNRSIGGRGKEQGGPNLGNDISRNISREVQSDDTSARVVKNKDQNKKKQNSKSPKKTKRS
jgi:hypothetical protein